MGAVFSYSGIALFPQPGVTFVSIPDGCSVQL